MAPIFACRLPQARSPRLYRSSKSIIPSKTSSAFAMSVLPRVTAFPILAEDHMLYKVGGALSMPTREKHSSPLLGHPAPEIILKDQLGRDCVSISLPLLLRQCTVCDADRLIRSSYHSHFTPLLHLVAQSYCFSSLLLDPLIAPFSPACSETPSQIQQSLPISTQSSSASLRTLPKPSPASSASMISATLF